INHKAFAIAFFLPQYFYLYIQLACDTSVYCDLSLKSGGSAASTILIARSRSICYNFQKLRGGCNRDKRKVVIIRLASARAIREPAVRPASAQSFRNADIVCIAYIPHNLRAFLRQIGRYELIL